MPCFNLNSIHKIHCPNESTELLYQTLQKNYPKRNKCVAEPPYHIMYIRFPWTSAFNQSVDIATIATSPILYIVFPIIAQGFFLVFWSTEFSKIFPFKIFAKSGTKDPPAFNGTTDFGYIYVFGRSLLCH